MESTAPGLLVSNPYLEGILVLQLLSLYEIHTKNLTIKVWFDACAQFLLKQDLLPNL